MSFSPSNICLFICVIIFFVYSFVSPVYINLLAFGLAFFFLSLLLGANKQP